MQVYGDMGGSLRLGSWKDGSNVLHDSTGPHVILLVFVCICPALLTIQDSMPVSGQVVVPQGQCTWTMMAVGLPQKGYMVHLKPCESQTSPAQRSPGCHREEVRLVSGREETVRTGPARGGFLEEIASFNAGLWSEKDVDDRGGHWVYCDSMPGLHSSALVVEYHFPTPSLVSW